MRYPKLGQSAKLSAAAGPYAIAHPATPGAGREHNRDAYELHLDNYLSLKEMIWVKLRQSAKIGRMPGRVEDRRMISRMHREEISTATIVPPR